MHSQALIFAAILACAFAADTAPAPAPKEDERVKKDVLLGTVPYAYAAVPSAYVPSSYVYDDGKYYPGKYEKAYVAAPAAHVPVVSSYAAVPSYAVPAVSSYSAVHHVAPSYVAPSYVAGYPYVRSYVY
uniref:Uncharacterized protein n=1 Tax=Lygus hesperus TaxID=30085 RepID=A0A0A9XPL8_LYGHE